MPLSHALELLKQGAEAVNISRSGQEEELKKVFAQQ
jgi:hypothetical protein